MCSRDGEIHWLSYKTFLEQCLGPKTADWTTNGQSRPTSRHHPGTVLLNRQPVPFGVAYSFTGHVPRQGAKESKVFHPARSSLSGWIHLEWNP